MLSKSSKGDAVAIAEAYRRKKRRETIGLHEDEVQKAKKFTEIINEHGSKNKHPESPVLAVSHKIKGILKQELILKSYRMLRMMERERKH